MVLELNELVETRLTERAASYGVTPEAFASALISETLEDEEGALSAAQRLLRRGLIEKILQDRVGRNLGYREDGLTFKEFAHLGHNR